MIAERLGGYSIAIAVLPRLWQEHAPTGDCLEVEWAGSDLELVVCEGQRTTIRFPPAETGKQRLWDKILASDGMNSAETSTVNLLLPCRPAPGRIAKGPTTLLEAAGWLHQLGCTAGPTTRLHEGAGLGIASSALWRLRCYETMLSLLDSGSSASTPQYRERVVRLAGIRGAPLGHSLALSASAPAIGVDCVVDSFDECVEDNHRLIAALEKIALRTAWPHEFRGLPPVLSSSIRAASILASLRNWNDSEMGLFPKMSPGTASMVAELDELVEAVLCDRFGSPGGGSRKSKLGSPRDDYWRFSINTWKLWEDLLVSSVLRHFAKALVCPSTPWEGLGGPVRPDLAIMVRSESGDLNLVVLDAKYKYATQQPSAADSQQMFTYSHLSAVAGRGLSAVCLVYPSRVSSIGGPYMRSRSYNADASAVPLLVGECPWPMPRDLSAWSDFERSLGESASQLIARACAIVHAQPKKCLDSC